MPNYFLKKDKSIVVHSQLEARKTGYKMMRSSKYIYDYVPIYDAKGKLYGEVTKSDKWIGFKTYSGDRINLQSLKENGEFGKPNPKPYFYIYGSRTYRFETPKDARISALRLNSKITQGMSSYDLDIFKETKSGSYLYQRLEIKGQGEVFCYLKEKFGYRLYKVERNGQFKKVR